MAKKYIPEEAEELIKHDPLVIQMKKTIESITRLLGAESAEISKKNLERYLKDKYGK